MAIIRSTGERFVDDIKLPGQLHVAFVRSDHAHGRLIKVDVSAARRRRGVAAVYTFDDLGDYGRPAPLLVLPPPVAGLVFHARTHRPLATGKVRYVGEPIAMIVAESRYLAEDAIRDVIVDIEPLEPEGDLGTRGMIALPGDRETGFGLQARSDFFVALAWCASQ